MTDIQHFRTEIMDFLTEEDKIELENKAGVRFPIDDLDWEYLCYICAWIGLKKGLPGNLHNRMVLGEQNPWAQLYVNTTMIKDQIRKIFELAS